MITEPVRVSADWLSLREPADAAARATAVVAEIASFLPLGAVTIHDLGSGSGAMGRWLAGRLSGPQHWVLYDRDDDLLATAAADPPGMSLDGRRVTVETRRRDITRLAPEELAGAALITSSAVLDMMTAEELERLIATCAAQRCPVLLPLNVTGHVEITPSEPFDHDVADAFNAHQRRVTPGGRLLGPAAVEAAVTGFTRLGMDLQIHTTHWRLGPDHAALAAEWFRGWLAPACEQRPELSAEAPAYARRRAAQAAAGTLRVTVEHADLLARPR